MSSGSASSCLRVLLADDHAVVREGVKALLKQEGFDVVAESSDGHAAIRSCETAHPDVAILDIGMPSLNGIDTARELTRQYPDLKIIILSMYSDQAYVLASLRAGVHGYVLKQNTWVDLVHAIESVRNGHMYFSPGVSGALVQACLANGPAAEDPLSTREREVLQLIAEGRTMKEVGDLLHISARTAETHRARIMEKLDIRNVAGLVRYSISHGLIVVEALQGNNGSKAQSESHS